MEAAAVSFTRVLTKVSPAVVIPFFVVDDHPKN